MDVENDKRGWRERWRERWQRWWPRRAPLPSSDEQRAIDLIKAIDAGGLPLNPARVNAIARGLGLEVSTRAPVEQTIERIRAAIGRLSSG